MKFKQIVVYILLWVYSKYKLFFNKKCFRNVDLYKLRGSEIILTHRLGGGTKVFTDGFVSNRKTLLLRNYSCRGKDFMFEIVDSSMNNRIYIYPRSLSDFLIVLKPKTIFVNSLVTYQNVFQVLKVLLYVKRKLNVSLRYFVHDYFSVCPNFNLVYNQKYCDLKCMDNRCVIDYLDNRKPCDISVWKKNWSIFLNQCDEIRCFSLSSKEIMTRVLGNRNKHLITVIPHQLEHTNHNIIKINTSAFNISVFGAITTVAKGGLVVKALADVMKDNEGKLYFFGEVSSKFRSNNNNVKYCGKYKHENIPSLLLKNKIGIVLFPSIWPETFSYIVSEMMELDMPIAAFNVGAQGEKVKNYKKGMLLSDLSGEQLYQSLREMWIRFNNIDSV